MTNVHEERVRLLNRRLELVTHLLGLNAEVQRASQRRGAVEIDILRLERAQHAGGSDLARNLRDAIESAATCRKIQEDCDARIEAAEQEMDEIDRMLAAIDGD